MRTLAFLLLYALSPAPRAEELAPSTAQAPAAAAPPSEPLFGAPLRLRFRVDDRGKPRGELGFSVRWETSDIRKLPRRAARLALDPFGTTERAAREALTGADVGFYSLSFKTKGILPVDFLLSPLTALAGWFAPTGAATLPAVGDSPPPPRRPPSDRRRRLNLTPARAEIERSLRRDLRRSLIEAGFDLAVPVPQKVPFAQKQAVYESLRHAGRVLDED